MKFIEDLTQFTEISRILTDNVFGYARLNLIVLEVFEALDLTWLEDVV